MIGVDRERALELASRLVLVVGAPGDGAEVRVRVGVVGLDAERGVEVRARLVGAPRALQRVAEIVETDVAAWIRGDCRAPERHRVVPDPDLPPRQDAEADRDEAGAGR